MRKLGVRLVRVLTTESLFRGAWDGGPVIRSKTARRSFLYNWARFRCNVLPFEVLIQVCRHGIGSLTAPCVDSSCSRSGGCSSHAWYTIVNPGWLGDPIGSRSFLDPADRNTDIAGFEIPDWNVIRSSTFNCCVGPWVSSFRSHLILPPDLRLLDSQAASRAIRFGFNLLTC